MRAILTSILLCVMVVGALFEAGPRQAWACTCSYFPTDPHEAVERLERIGSDTIVVLGVVEERTAEYPPAARVRTERVYKGRISKTFTVTSSDCNGIIANFKPGEQWLMELRDYEGTGEWRTGGCGAGVIRPTALPGRGAAAWAKALDEAGAPWTSPIDSGDGDSLSLSLPVAVLIAVSVGTLTLAAVYVAQRRRMDAD